MRSPRLRKSTASSISSSTASQSDAMNSENPPDIFKARSMSSASSTISGSDGQLMEFTEGLKDYSAIDFGTSPNRRSKISQGLKSLRRIRRQPSETKLAWMDGRSHLRMKEGKWSLLPTDLLGVERMNRMHYMAKYVFDGNHNQKLENPKHILDSGTGSGIWAREMAEEHPDCEVVGLDIVDLTSGEKMPDNFRWVEGNILKELPLKENQFDFIFQREVGFYVPTKRWASVLAELYRVCRPGGCILMVEIMERTERAGPATAELMKLMSAGLKISGVEWNALEYLDVALQQEGWIDVKREEIALATGGWAGSVGLFWLGAVQMMVEAAEPVLLKHSLCLPGAISQLLERMAKEVEENRTLYWLHLVSARKPIE